MCGRFTLIAPGEAIAELFQLTEIPSIAPRYNIAPTQPVAAIRLSPASGARELSYFHWGLIPRWAKDTKIGSRMINARSETAAEKPSFRSAFKYRRCLVPADGFYEWQKINGGKQPVRIQMKTGQPFANAGLWEHWISSDGSEIESCTLLTTEPNDLLSPVHNRMPVLLDPADFDQWLDTKSYQGDDVQQLLRPFSGEEMAFYPVSTHVNNPRNEGPLCVQPLAS